MSKGISTNSKREIFDNFKPSNSLIVANNKPLPLSPKNHKQPPEGQLPDKPVPIYRHNSEEELSRFPQRPFLMASSDILYKTEGAQKQTLGP